MSLITKDRRRTRTRTRRKKRNDFPNRQLDSAFALINQLKSEQIITGQMLYDIFQKLSNPQREAKEELVEIQEELESEEEIEQLISPGVFSIDEEYAAWAYQSMLPGTPGTGAYGIGVPDAANIGNAPSAGATVNTLASRWASNAAAGHINGFNSNFTVGGVIKRETDFELIVNIETIPTITNIRIWIGFTTSNTGIDADTWDGFSGADILMWRFSTVAGDNGWKIVSKTGGANGTVSAQVGSNLLAGTRQVLRIRLLNTGTPTAFCSVNDSAETVVTATLPAATRALNYNCTIIPQAASIRTFEHSRTLCKFKSNN